MTIHYDDGKGVAACRAKLDKNSKSTKQWSRVTCKNCKQTATREMKDF